MSVPASVVQDALLDLWGHLPEGEIRTEVERWLTETLERNLYSVGDVDARLAHVLPDRLIRRGRRPCGKNRRHGRYREPPSERHLCEQRRRRHTGI